MKNETLFSAVLWLLLLASCGNTESFRITVFDNDTDQLECDEDVTP